MDYTLGAIEKRFAELIWQNEPLSSGRLTVLAHEALGWKKSTTYTVLRRLCDKGLFQNQGGQVSALLTQEEFAARQSEQFLQESFGGSLPRFVAAFIRRQKLSDAEVEALKALIEQSRR